MSDDGRPPFSSDGEFIGPRRMPVIDLPTVMRDTACAALSTIDQAVEADNGLAAHLEPVRSFLIMLMSWPISLQSAGDNLELQAGGSLKLIEELLQRLHLVDSKGNFSFLPQGAGPAALQRLHHLLLDLAVLASSRFIDQQFFSAKGAPQVLKDRWLAMFPMTYYDHALMSRLGNAKAHIFTLGVMCLRKRKRCYRGAVLSRRSHGKNSSHGRSSSAAAVTSATETDAAVPAESSSASAAAETDAAAPAQSSSAAADLGTDACFFHMVHGFSHGWADSLDEHAAESWWAADWWTDAGAPAEPAADESFCHSWAEAAAEESAAARATCRSAGQAAASSSAPAAEIAAPGAGPGRHGPATSQSGPERSSCAERSEEEETVRRQVVATMEDDADPVYDPDLTWQILAIVQDDFYVEFPLRV